MQIKDQNEFCEMFPIILARLYSFLYVDKNNKLLYLSIEGIYILLLSQCYHLIKISEWA